jgi:FixJ family two-component response regulator
MNRRPCSEAPERSQKGQEPTIRCAVLDEDKTQTELVAKLLSDAGHNCELFRQGRTLLNR